MIAFPRRAARWFRAACARCTAGRTRGPAPPVIVRHLNARTTLTAAFPEVVLELICATASTRGDEVLVVPMTALEGVAANSDELVTFDAGEQLRGTARWGAGESAPVTFVLPGRQHDPLPRPETKSAPARLLSALHEAGRTASREDGRYALSRVQVRGATGQVIGTDGKVAVIFSGFAFPFAGDVLVPAVPLFGCPEVRDEDNVRIGCTSTHLVVSAGDWTAWLSVAPAGQFPDVNAVVPRRGPTTVVLDPGDATALRAQLPALLGGDHEHRPITLDAPDGGVLAMCAGAASEARTVPCPNSPVRGSSGRVVLDRRVLARALALGCRTLRLTPDQALAAEGEGVTVLAAPLDPALATAPATPTRRNSVPHAIPSISKPERERTIVMNSHETNGPAPNGRHDPPATDAGDPLVVAEELRTALTAAATQAARLVAALRQSKKEKKVLATVLTSLKQLNLSAEGDPR